ncbi:MAG: hypothetical protein J6G98_00115 [Bacilli bacterium]|nr:hypothetical protein [Bacilli bacterium]
MKKVTIILTSLVLLFTLTGCGKKSDDTKNTKNNNTKNEQSTNVTFEKQTIGDVTFDSFAVTKDSNGVQVIFFSIVNETDKEVEVKTVNIKLLSGGATVLTLKEEINSTLNPGDTIDISENIDVALDNVDKVEYTLE